MHGLRLTAEMARVLVMPSLGRVGNSPGFLRIHERRVFLLTHLSAAGASAAADKIKALQTSNVILLRPE
jgi:hypothetical protein